LQSQVVKLKTDKDVKEITIKHLRTELDSKTAAIRRQTEELASLRETILELQRQNTLLKQMQFKENFNPRNAPESR
jgi:uncharacterized membrane protein